MGSVCICLSVCLSVCICDNSWSGFVHLNPKKSSTPVWILGTNPLQELSQKRLAVTQMRQGTRFGSVQPVASRTMGLPRLVLYQMYGKETGTVPGQNCYVSSKTAKEIVDKRHFAFPVCFHTQVHCIYLGCLYTLDVSSGLPK